MKRTIGKRPKLTDRQKFCLRMIGEHGLTGSYTEFSRPQTRRTVHSLQTKRLVQWVDGRWILTRDGDAEWRLLLLDRAKQATA